MVSQDKLIKNGIQYTDELFEEITRRINEGVLSSDTLEEFLEKTRDYTTSNPVVTSGYDNTMLQLILSETNNHKFSRPSQKELARITIENYVGDLIRNVGEDIKRDVREIVKEGFNNRLSQSEIADLISERITSIKNTRARAIARTEIARTATVSDYIINKESGATHFVVDCRDTACPVCKERFQSNPLVEATGKRLIGDVRFSIDDVSMLPPVHPNCRCSAVFSNEESREKLKGKVRIVEHRGE